MSKINKQQNKINKKTCDYRSYLLH
jgi:hypothetical protein